MSTRNKRHGLWEDVKGYEGYYKVNNLGQVYSTKSSKQLKTFVSQGYLCVNLSKDGKRTRKFVAYLVAKAFISKQRITDKQVYYRNHNKSDCRVTNLYWGVKSIGNGGARNGSAKLDPEDVKEIKLLLEDGMPQTKVANQFDVSASTIHGIASGRNWKNV